MSFVGDEPAVEREGLPREYRMRADEHYIDQLESRHEGPAIRLIPTQQIENSEPASLATLEPLVDSISAHGMLQPLLVRRQHGRYHVIAGRKRLAAAIAAGASEVPCLIHDADDTRVAALARAANLRLPLLPNESPRSDDDRLQQQLRTMSSELANISSLAAVLRTTPNGWSQRATVDVIQARAWRAAWLAGATEILVAPHQATRPRPIASIVDRVAFGFEAEARLTRLRLDCSVAPSASSFAFDEGLGILVVTSGILATLSWLQDCEEPRIEVHVEVLNPRILKIEVVQRIKAVAADVAHLLEVPGFPASPGSTAALGLWTVKSLAAQHGGAAEFALIAGRGTVIQSTFCEPAEN